MTMELQTGEFPGWDRSPVAFIRTCVVSQFATIATTHNSTRAHRYISCAISERCHGLIVLILLIEGNGNYDCLIIDQLNKRSPICNSRRFRFSGHVLWKNPAHATRRQTDRQTQRHRNTERKSATEDDCQALDLCELQQNPHAWMI